MAGHVKCANCGIVLRRMEERDVRDDGLYTHKPGLCRGDKAKNPFFIGYKNGQIVSIWRMELDYKDIVAQVDELVADGEKDIRVELLNRKQLDRRMAKLLKE